MNDELETMWNEAVTAYIKVISWNSTGGPEETRKNLNQDSWCPVKDSNQTPPKYKLQALPPEPT